MCGETRLSRSMTYCNERCCYVCCSFCEILSSFTLFKFRWSFEMNLFPSNPKTSILINTSFINRSIRLNDHALPSRLQLISTISMYDTYVNIIYFGRCNKPIARRNEVIIVIVFDTYCFCTMLMYSTNYVR